LTQEKGGVFFFAFVWAARGEPVRKARATKKEGALSFMDGRS
jgi:hypothetical protein